MDLAKAEALTERLVGQAIDGWTIASYINHGKSAAVFKGSKEGIPAAIKIFDSELIERYGDKTQVARIKREVDLVGKHHQNLVSIYGGGHDEDHDLYFIVMEFVDGPNLKECLGEIKPTSIASLTSQLASAAKFLEGLGLVHRDIKPENIAILDDGRTLKLLDLGVVRPIGLGGLTDPEEIKAFVGTLQYSSPEFLVRDEIDDLEGWRALNFYQIGAVLHDMIMGRPLLAQFAEPYAKLVIAVQSERPVITNPDVDPRLLRLAENCLLKKAASRLRLVDWDSFEAICRPAANVSTRDRVLEAMASMRAAQEEVTPSPPGLTNAQLRDSILRTLREAAVAARVRMEGLPPLSTRLQTGSQKGLLLTLEASNGPFAKKLSIWLDVNVHDAEEAVIECVGLAAAGALGAQDFREQSISWHSDVLDHTSLNVALEDFFYGAIEWFLHASPGLHETDHLIWLGGER